MPASLRKHGRARARGHLDAPRFLVGAYKFEVTLRDTQVEEFIAAAFEPYTADGSVSDWEFGMRENARHIAERFIQAAPELAQYAEGAE